LDGTKYCRNPQYSKRKDENDLNPQAGVRLIDATVNYQALTIRLLMIYPRCKPSGDLPHSGKLPQNEFRLSF
jgi:hypothetical protein